MIGYLAAYLLIPLFGLSLAWRIEDRCARAGFAFLAGMFLLTVEATLFSIGAIKWNIALLSLPLIVASALVIWRRGNPARPDTRHRLSSIALAIIALSTLHFALMCVTTQAVSADYLLFWGAKSVRFAAARAIDPELLRWVWFLHGQREYPPLVPVFQAWGTLFSGEFPWITAAALSALWPLAAAPVIYWLVSRGRDARTAAYATAFWTAAVASSLAYSLSGGNAEAMLVAYLSVAAAALVAGEYAIAAIGLAGALLTKEEALISVVALIAATALRDLILRKPRWLRGLTLIVVVPFASLGLWFFYQWRWGLQVGYRRYASYVVLHFENAGVIARAMIRNLEAGSWWLAWIVPAAFLLWTAFRSPRRLLPVLPLLITVPLLFAFFVYVYLQQSAAIVEMRIGWTLPRIAQPAMSFLILAAAFAAGGIPADEDG